MADNYCACNGGEDAEYIIELNQQGPPGVQGEQGEQGYSPVVSYTVNDDTIQFTLVNQDTTSTTPNFYNYVAKKSVVDNHSILIQNNTDAIDGLEANKLDKDGSNADNPITLNGFSLTSTSNYSGTLSRLGTFDIDGTDSLRLGRNTRSVQIGSSTNGFVTIYSKAGESISLRNSNGLALSAQNTIVEVHSPIDDSLQRVATVDQIPSVGNGTITLTQGGVTKGTFTTNQSGNTTIDLDAGSAITNPLIIEDDTTGNDYLIGFTTVGENRIFNSAIRVNGQTGYDVGNICTALSFNPLTYVDAGTLIPGLAGAKFIQLKYDNNTLKINQDGQLYADISAPTYTAGTGIDITNDTISINNTVALKTDIPSLTGYATEQWVTQQGYITSVNNTQPDANGNVTLSIPDVSNYYTKPEADTLLDDKQDKLTSQNAGDGITIYEYYPDAVEIDYHAKNSSNQYESYTVADPSAWVSTRAQSPRGISLTGAISNLSTKSFEYIALVPYSGGCGIGLNTQWDYSSSLNHQTCGIFFSNDGGEEPTSSSFIISGAYYKKTNSITISSSEYLQIQKQGGVWFKITSDGSGNYGAYYSFDNNTWIEVVFSDNSRFVPAYVTAPSIGTYSPYTPTATFDLTKADFQYTPAREPYVKIGVDSTVYYTKAQVDALLQAKQDLIDALTVRVTALETNINGGNA